MLVTVRIDLELRLLMSMPWPLIILKTEHIADKWCVCFPLAQPHRHRVLSRGGLWREYKDSTNVCHPKVDLWKCAALHHTLQQIFYIHCFFCFFFLGCLLRGLKKKKKERERNDPEAIRRRSSWVLLDMLFIVLSQLLGDYNKSYSSCA